MDEAECGGGLWPAQGRKPFRTMRELFGMLLIVSRLSCDRRLATANPLVISKPSPRAAPVMSATCPSKPPLTDLFPLRPAWLLPIKARRSGWQPELDDDYSRSVQAVFAGHRSRRRRRPSIR